MEEEDTIGDSDEIYCSIYDVTLDEDDEVVYFRSYDPTETGTLKVSVNNVNKYTDTVSTSDYDEYDEYYLSLYLDDLEIDSAGDYTIKVTFNDELVEESTIHVSNYNFNMYAMLDEDEGTQSSFGYGDTIIFKIYLPDDATNRLTLTVNGKTYDVAYKEGMGKISISTLGWNFGEYNAVARYEGNSKYPSESTTEEIYIQPKIDCPDRISIGEQESISIKGPSGLNGNAVVTISKYDKNEDEYVQFSVQNVAILNGYGSYSLAGLPENEYRIHIDYKFGSYEDYDTCWLEVLKNSPGFSSSVTPTVMTVGNNVNVQISGPKINDKVDIFVNDKSIKSINLINGPINEVISNLPVGTHKINIYFDNGEYFYSNTVFVTVKQVQAPTSQKTKTTISLTLKKVTVKKSAKKLILQATLKINKKVAKGKKITFKFNGKKYTAKTNAKGIAKVTIKKSVLKKLKVGKKITYTAKYSTKTVKKTVKVKK